MKGKITNSKNEMVYFQTLSSGKYRLIDSIKLDENGMFHFKDSIQSPQYLLVGIPPQNFVSLFIEPDTEMTFEADISNLNKYHAEGSDAIKLTEKLNFDYQELTVKTDSLYKNIQEKLAVPEVDSVIVIDEFQKEIKNIILNHRSLLIDFVNNNLSSPTCYFALMQKVDDRTAFFNLTEHIDLFKKVDKSLYKKYSNFELARNLHEFLKRYEQEMELRAQREKSGEKIDNQGNGTLNIGTTAFEIVEKNPKGELIKLSSFKGKYVLLDFWASWCKPCRQENPNLVKAYKKYQSKGFEIFQVSLDKDKNAWENAIEKDKLNNWVHVSDLKFWDAKAARLYKISKIPTNYLLDKEGKVIAIDLRGKALEDKLAEIFK